MAMFRLLWAGGTRRLGLQPLRPLLLRLSSSNASAASQAGPSKPGWRQRFPFNVMGSHRAHLFALRVKNIGGNLRKPHSPLPRPKRRFFFFKPTVYIPLGLFVTYYISRQEIVPLTNRRRTMWIPKWMLDIFGQLVDTALLSDMKERIYPESSREHRQVHRVVQQLCEANSFDMPAIYVVYDDEPNAMCTAGGTLFVNSGLLRFVKNDDELAVVLGHELGHRYAGHAGELSSLETLSKVFAYTTGSLFGFVGLAVATMTWMSNLFTRNRSRALENEADYIGIMLCAQACFNIKCAEEFWTRMLLSEVAGWKAALIEAETGEHVEGRILVTDDDVASFDKMQERNRLYATHPSLVSRLEHFRPSHDWMLEAQRVQNFHCSRHMEDSAMYTTLNPLKWWRLHS